MKSAFCFFSLFFVLGSALEAEPHKVVQRGGSVTLEVSFKADLQVQSAFLTWQTYDSMGPSQAGMSSSFVCPARIVSSQQSVQLSCEIPLNVADGHYYLTSVSVETGQYRRKYSFQHELPTDIELDVKGGNRAPVPNIKTIHFN